MTPEQQAEIREAVKEAIRLAKWDRKRGFPALGMPAEKLAYIEDTANSVADAAMAAHLKALEAVGFVVVPAELDAAGDAGLNMLIAGKKSLFSCSEDPELDDARKCYRAMLEARPR